MRYFIESEFSGYYDLLSEDLKTKLDLFRERWGAPVSISKADGAVGRRDGSHSQHNINRWGEVRAVDVFPKGLKTRQDAEEAYQIATDLGFKGFGLYPDWNKGVGIHLDVRQTNVVAKWSYVNGRYMSLDYGMDRLKNEQVKQ